LFSAGNVTACANREVTEVTERRFFGKPLISERNFMYAGAAALATLGAPDSQP
jgi:hypothetical protein